MAFDISKYQQQAAQLGPNMAEASEGGGDFAPPPEGVCRLRLVAYVECGKHTRVVKGESKTRDKVQIVFELSGPKHAPQEIDGEKVPFRISILENAGKDYGPLTENSNLYKLFKAMNYDGTATHFAQLVGKEFLGTVVHNKQGDKVYANLRNEQGYTIRPPVFEDPETGESKRVAVAPAISPLRLFLWNMADLEMWSSLFISQERNPFQKTIRQADNFVGSPIQIALQEAGLDDKPVAKQAKQEEAKKEEAQPGKASDDVLNGIGA